MSTLRAREHKQLVETQQLNKFIIRNVEGFNHKSELTFLTLRLHKATLHPLLLKYELKEVDEIGRGEN